MNHPNPPSAPGAASSKAAGIQRSPEQVKATLEKIAAGFDKVSSGLNPLQRFLKWSVSEWRSRTIFSFSRLTVTESLENRINEGTPDGLRAAIQVDSANARLAAHFGRSLARYALNRIFRAIKQEIDPAEAQRALAETDFQTRRALKLAPDDEKNCALKWSSC
jgi:hypothetical protein